MVTTIMASAGNGTLTIRTIGTFYPGYPYAEKPWFSSINPHAKQWTVSGSFSKVQNQRHTEA